MCGTSNNNIVMRMKCLLRLSGMFHMWIILIQLSTKQIMNFIIRLLLLRQGVEGNPGPGVTHSNMTLKTYNCNGLGNLDNLQLQWLRSS